MKNEDKYEMYSDLISWIECCIYEITSDKFYEEYDEFCDDYYMYTVSPSKEEYKIADELAEILIRIKSDSFWTSKENIEIVYEEVLNM